MALDWVNDSLGLSLNEEATTKQLLHFVDWALFLTRGTFIDLSDAQRVTEERSLSPLFI